MSKLITVALVILRPDDERGLSVLLGAEAPGLPMELPTTYAKADETPREAAWRLVRELNLGLKRKVLPMRPHKRRIPGGMQEHLRCVYRVLLKRKMLPREMEERIQEGRLAWNDGSSLGSMPEGIHIDLASALLMGGYRR